MNNVIVTSHNLRNKQINAKLNGLEQLTYPVKAIWILTPHVSKWDF